MKGGHIIIDYNKSNKTKEELITATFRKLRLIYKNLDKDRKNIAEKLCRKAAFMDVSLDFLQEEIIENGSIIETTNGNGFKVLVENPALKSYNTMFKNYSTCIKQLVDILPEGSTDADELLNFVRGKKK